MKAEEIKEAVRNRYGELATGGSCRFTPASSCCGSTPGVDLSKEIGKKMGYSEEELHSVPEGANLGLGCGNPTALASLREGEIVLDLGSGAGFDAFLAARKVGPQGKVIGVDMTPEMIDTANSNAEKGNYANVEFRLGEIESLPVADDSVDVVISNCVINLAPNKTKVFREAFRVLKPGGRFMVSDIVLLKELPGLIKSSVPAMTGCIAGALLKNDYLEAIRAAGFRDVNVVGEVIFPIAEDERTAAEISRQLEIPTEIVQQATDNLVSSIKVQGEKP